MGKIPLQWLRDSTGVTAWTVQVLHKWRHSWDLKQFFTSALRLVSTEKSEMSSSEWLTPTKSELLPKTTNPRHVRRVQAPDSTRGTPTPGLEWFSIVISITVTHCQITPRAQLIHCSSSSSSTAPPSTPATVLSISTPKLTNTTAYSRQWICYTTLASRCSHHPPTGSGDVALCHPTPRVTFSLLNISLLSLPANHPTKLLGCHMEILQATEESTIINCP